MEYQTVYETSEYLYDGSKKLDNKVNELIKDGWEPQGGVSVSPEVYGHKTWYTLCQAMVKRECPGQCGVRIY